MFLPNHRHGGRQPTPSSESAAIPGTGGHTHTVTGLLEGQIRASSRLPSVESSVGLIHFVTCVVSFESSPPRFKPVKEVERGIRGFKELGGLPRRAGQSLVEAGPLPSQDLLVCLTAPARGHGI